MSKNMKIIKDIKNIFIKKEINKFWIIFLGIFITTILDAVSFATIIPIFNIIFLNKLPSIPFFDNQILELTFNLKIIFLLIFICIFYLKNLFVIAFNFFYLDFLRSIDLRIANDLFKNYLSQEYKYFLQKSSENFLQKVNNDVIALNNFLAGCLSFCIELIFLFTICLILLIANYQIFLICFISFFIILFIYYKLFKKRIHRWADVYRTATGKVQSLVMNGSQGFKDIILYDLKNNFIRDFNHYFIESSRTYSRINFLNNAQKYWLELVAFSVLVVALFYFLIAGFEINQLIPVFGLFVVAMFRLLTSINRIIFAYHGIKFSYPSYKAIALEFNDFYNRKNINKAEIKINFNEFIEFKKVKFSYLDNNYNIINNINLKIKKGNCIAIVGKNGSGKTTLLNLVAGIIKPTEGSITADETSDIYNNDNWFKKLSYVQQNVFLLDNTIKANISLVSEDQIDTQKFNRVNELLKLEEFFKTLPDKLSTKVGINGISLSGGQKQIISLARALYKDGEVLIFDEVSSALDLTMTKLVKEIIQFYRGKKTIIAVTHDIEFFLECFDKIFEINPTGLKIKN